MLACLLARLLSARLLLPSLPVDQRGCSACALLWSCCAGKSFGFVGEDLAMHRITDDQLVQCFKGRTNIAFVFLNGCGTTSVCRRLQLECGIPVVLGWDDDEVPSQQCLAMVRVLSVCSGDRVRLSCLLCLRGSCFVCPADSARLDSLFGAVLCLVAVVHVHSPAVPGSDVLLRLRRRNGCLQEAVSSVRTGSAAAGPD